MAPSAGRSQRSDLVHNLENVLLDLYRHPYPEIPSPPETPKRASVALIVRIQPRYSHWPPSSRRARRSPDESRQSDSVEDRIKRFFAQEWVQWGDPEVLFIKRAARKGDRWTSHVALPGGGRDAADKDDQAAAVREAQEEVGLELSEEVSVAVGNLPQQVVKSSWGKVTVMVLCPYVFLLTTNDIPPLRLQPSEVASAHWVPLRALLSPRQRTFWYQDVSSRTSRHDLGLKKLFHHATTGDMLFAAVRLIPSESVYCSSIAEFMADDEDPVKEQDTLNLTVPLLAIRRSKAPSPVDAPLLLWGLTLGVMSDFLDLLPPHNALRLWVYPTFTQPDVRLILWLLSYRFRQRKQRELDDRYRALGLPVGGETSILPGSLGTRSTANLNEVGDGRWHGRVRADKRGSRNDAVGLLLEGYYDLVRKAVTISLFGRGVAILALSWAFWRKLRG